MNDNQAYLTFPTLRHWYNKLWLSEQLGYECGPSSIAPTHSGWYIIRPVINLAGMGLGASKCYINAGDSTVVPPGYFWCAWFEGPQYSVTYSWDGYWKPLSCWQGIKDSSNLSRFIRWIKSDNYPQLDSLYNELRSVQTINVEFINNNAIEVHLRESPDPQYNELLPVWQDSEIEVDSYRSLGYTYINSYEDADGFLPVSRLGFLVK